MKKVYTLDLNVLTEQDLSIQEVITLISLDDIDVVSNNTEQDLENLEKKGFIKIVLEENEKIEIITKKGKLLVDSVNALKFPKKRGKIINYDINDFTMEFRNLWKGLKPGSMGSQNACNDKMARWLRDNPAYKKEDVMKAAKTYLKSVNDYRFLQAADYFIYKKDAHGESSRLSAFIDEAETPNDEWSSQLS